MRRAGRRGAAAASVLLTGFLVTGGLIAVPYLLLTAPVEDYSLTALEPASQRTLVLHTNDGTPFARRGGCVAETVSLDEVPQHFIDALLSMEDRRFYYHLGIDPIGLARAAMENRAAGRIVQGGSTITQQLAKYSLLSSDRTMERKRKEAWLALSLELRLSKDEILERYLSSAYFGQGCYGLRAAAKQYFGATVPDVTIPQSAYLVALLKSPTALNRDPEAARQRGMTCSMPWSTRESCRLKTERTLPRSCPRSRPRTPRGAITPTGFPAPSSCRAPAIIPHCRSIPRSIPRSSAWPMRPWRRSSPRRARRGTSPRRPWW
jgi:membrane peptidoglycan carboxypeptidase